MIYFGHLKECYLNMETCIYLFDKKSGLSYKKREHVISAGIGGKRTLPKGYVSDQANELFSKYELMCLRYSPIQIARARYGPGKRGSLSINSIDVPDVFSLCPLEASNQTHVCPLGFLFQNKAYILPQIIVLFDANTENFKIIHLRSTYQTSGNINDATFLSRLREFLISNKKVYKNIKVPYDTKRRFVCIGCYKKTWYICSTQPNFDIDNLVSQILEEKTLNTIPAGLSDIVLNKPIFQYTRKIDLEYIVPTFIHAKNCFNSLALFTKSKFVQQTIFNQFRQCILTNSDWETVLVPSNKVPYKIIQWAINHLQCHEHIVVIYTDGKYIMAFSVLYGESWALFKLATEYHGKPFSRAIICDFQHTQEILYDSDIV